MNDSERLEAIEGRKLTGRLYGSDDAVSVTLPVADYEWLISEVRRLEALNDAKDRVIARVIRESNEWESKAEGREEPRRTRPPRARASDV